MTTADAHDEAAWFGLARESRALPLVARFTVDGEPRSKARPRLGRGGNVYTPRKSAQAEEEIGWAFRQVAGSYTPHKNDTFGLCALFFAATRQRRDVDNMLKLISDGLNGIAWVDDAQVVEMSGRKTYVDRPDEARTEVLVYRVGADLPPSKPCAHCDKPIRVYDSTSSRKYCTPECRYAASRDRRRKPCPVCGVPFVSRGAQSFCSAECRDEAQLVALNCEECGEIFRLARSISEQRRALCSSTCRDAFWRKHRLIAARGKCMDCGGHTSKKQYKRCRACNTAHRSKGAA